MAELNIEANDRSKGAAGQHPKTKVSKQEDGGRKIGSNFLSVPSCRSHSLIQ